MYVAARPKLRGHSVIYNTYLVGKKKKGITKIIAWFT